MHAAVCLLHAGQLKGASDVGKSREFLGEFSWVEFDAMSVRGLNVLCFDQFDYPQTIILKSTHF